MESMEDGSVHHEAEYIEEKGEEEEDEDGPPPGWESIAPLARENPSLSPLPTTPLFHQPRLLKEEEQIQNLQDDDDDDGWLSNLTPPPSPVREEDQREIESMEAQPALEEEDGPPPGWPSLPSSAVTPTSSMFEPPVEPASALPPSPSEEDEREIKPMEVQPTEAEEEAQANVEEDGPPPGWQSIPPPASTQTTLPLLSSSASGPSIEPPSAPPPQPSEMAQMVCGSCQRLLSYPKGSRHVKCACCQTTNIVLEAHELGIVKCGSCTILLMYPYAASSVRCASCRFVTEIGEHNKRPPWSIQQGYPPPTSPVH